jgi:hypothetical protein
VQEWSNDWSDIGALLEEAKNAKPKPLTKTGKYLKACEEWKKAFEKWLNHQRAMNRIKHELCENEEMDALTSFLELVDPGGLAVKLCLRKATPIDAIPVPTSPQQLILWVDNKLLDKMKNASQRELEEESKVNAPHPGPEPDPHDYGLEY